MRKDRLTARNGSPYLSLELRDRSGTIPARAFREVDRLAARYDVPAIAIATAWITRHPAKMQVVLGTTTPSRVADAALGSEIPLTRAEWYELFRAAAAGPLAGILGFETRPLVSADYANDTRIAIVDGPSTMVTDGTLLKVYAWYDNEMGYACRMVDLANIVIERGA